MATDEDNLCFWSSSLLLFLHGCTPFDVKLLLDKILHQLYYIVYLDIDWIFNIPGGANTGFLPNHLRNPLGLLFSSRSLLFLYIHIHMILGWLSCTLGRGITLSDCHSPRTPVTLALALLHLRLCLTDSGGVGKSDGWCERKLLFQVLEYTSNIVYASFPINFLALVFFVSPTSLWARDCGNLHGLTRTCWSDSTLSWFTISKEKVTAYFLGAHHLMGSNAEIYRELPATSDIWYSWRTTRRKALITAFDGFSQPLATNSPLFFCPSPSFGSKLLGSHVHIHTCRVVRLVGLYMFETPLAQARSFFWTLQMIFVFCIHKNRAMIPSAVRTRHCNFIYILPKARVDDDSVQ